MAITAYSLGAAQEVTGSKHILEIDGRCFMIDCGAFQGKRAEADRKNREFSISPDKIEGVILTHAHYDHSGLLPILTKRGYGGSIYATPATRDLANIVMMDSARIQARDAEFLAKQAARKKEKFTWKPLYTESDCVQAANQIITVGYNRKMYIAPDVQLEFFDAGHILGSSLVYLTVSGQRKSAGAKGDAAAAHWHRLFEEESAGNIPSARDSDEVRILYTGDLGRKNKPIIRNPAVNMPPPDYIFMESTYGDRLHAEASSAMKELEKIVRRAVDTGAKIIIPTFAIERAQELVFYLHLLSDQKKIPPIPIYMDSPMAVNATGIYQLHPECYDKETNEAFLAHHKNPFGFNSLQFITSVSESKELNNKEGPMIILSADGMCEAGRILYHLANNISNPKNIILIVGYMSEHTLGRKIQEGQKEVKILGDWYKVKAQVKQLDSFSAHADYQEMTDWLKAVDTSRLKKLFLVHGEKNAQEHLSLHLAENGFSNVEIIKYGETYSLE